jgi:hypothetical protein
MKLWPRSTPAEGNTVRTYSETTDPRTPGIDQLQSAFQQELASDKWAAAETAFALASRFRDAGDVEAAQQWLQQLLTLLAEFPAASPEQAATRRRQVGGVMMPDFLHEGVVKTRFEGLLRTV